MRTATLAALIGATLAIPAVAELRFDGYGRFGAFYDESKGKLEPTSRLRLSLDGETSADNGLELSFRLRLQADDGGTAMFNGARFTLRSGPLRFDVGNVAGAIDTMPGFYGAEPGLTDLMNQAQVLRAGFDEYDSSGPGRDGVSLRYSRGAVQVAASHSDTRGRSRTAAHLAYSTGQGTIAIGYQSSNRRADDGLAVLAYTHDFEWGKAGLIAAREDAGTVLGASLNWEISATTEVLAAFSATRGREDFGLGLSHDLGGGATVQGGVASVAGNVVADFGIRFDF
ncbi:porin [Marimonas lutisalis]|uniref:porin n=1 Tax=Marimonas lutisalis TaxID=2545756 RepID=UPI001375ACED|nr:porin [Marimonas lutisalis]